MTMHLAHPALSTTGRRRGRQKWASAEAKRLAQELADSWEQKTKEFKKMSTVSRKTTAASQVQNTPRVPPGRETPKIPSLNSWVTGAVSSKPSQQYTGDQVKGIAVMHKSCLQPVFNQQEAIDSAKMRR